MFIARLYRKDGMHVYSKVRMECMFIARLYRKDGMHVCFLQILYMYCFCT